MLNCAKCGHIVHETARACPQCGTPPSAARWNARKIIKIMALVVGGYVAICMILATVEVIRHPLAVETTRNAADATPSTDAGFKGQVVWYLLAPDSSVRMSQWEKAGTFNSQSTCEKSRSDGIADLRKMVSDGQKQVRTDMEKRKDPQWDLRIVQSMGEGLAAAGAMQCFPSDDPRLR